jgi:hypothetical protein
LDSEEDSAKASSDLETRQRREGGGGEETTVKERSGGGVRVVRAVADDSGEAAAD